MSLKKLQKQKTGGQMLKTYECIHELQRGQVLKDSFQ